MEKLYSLIEPNDGDAVGGRIYDSLMVVVIAASLVPLAFKESNPFFDGLEIFATVIFCLDYLLRLITAEEKLHRGTASYFIYPFTPAAIIDLISVLPSFQLLGEGFRVLRIMRLVRSVRVFRAFKLLRYSKNFAIIVSVFRKQRGALLAVCWLAAAYIVVSALIIFNVEPDSFESFFEAVYWATVSLTTVGYGDIYPVTTAGRIITMFSAVLGIAIIALPAGIITAGYLNELDRHSDADEHPPVLPEVAAALAVAKKEERGE